MDNDNFPWFLFVTSATNIDSSSSTGTSYETGCTRSGSDSNANGELAAPISYHCYCKISFRQSLTHLFSPKVSDLLLANYLKSRTTHAEIILSLLVLIGRFYSR